MAKEFRVYVDGQYVSFTAEEYSASFGYLPDSPREGERLFGGRYEHKTFISGSGEDNPNGVLYNMGNSTTSSRAGGY